MNTPVGTKNYVYRRNRKLLAFDLRYPMTKQMVLTKFSVRAIGVNMPGNWDRPVGYEGHAHFVSVYRDSVDHKFEKKGLTLGGSTIVTTE